MRETIIGETELLPSPWEGLTETPDLWASDTGRLRDEPSVKGGAPNTASDEWAFSVGGSHEGNAASAFSPSGVDRHTAAIRS